MPISVKAKKVIGEKLKKQRESDKRSLRQTASECDITPASLSSIENGVNFPSEKTFLCLVELLNFKDKAKMYDLYGEFKETVPLDISEYILKHPNVIEELRERIKKSEEIL